MPVVIVVALLVHGRHKDQNNLVSHKAKEWLSRMPDELDHLVLHYFSGQAHVKSPPHDSGVSASRFATKRGDHSHNLRRQLRSAWWARASEMGRARVWEGLFPGAEISPRQDLLQTAGDGGRASALSVALFLVLKQEIVQKVR